MLISKTIETVYNFLLSQQLYKGKTHAAATKDNSREYTKSGQIERENTLIK